MAYWVLFLELYTFYLSNRKDNKVYCLVIKTNIVNKNFVFENQLDFGKSFYETTQV